MHHNHNISGGSGNAYSGTAGGVASNTAAQLTAVELI